MQVCNLVNSNGNIVKNQFQLESKTTIVFQSYDSVICKVSKKTRKIIFDKTFLNTSTTTAKHLNSFLKSNDLKITLKDIRKDHKLVTFKTLN